LTGRDGQRLINFPDRDDIIAHEIITKIKMAEWRHRPHMQFITDRSPNKGAGAERPVVLSPGQGKVVSQADKS
jgi:hypothetical protein